MIYRLLLMHLHDGRDIRCQVDIVVVTFDSQPQVNGAPELG